MKTNVYQVDRSNQHTDKPMRLVVKVFIVLLLYCVAVVVVKCENNKGCCSREYAIPLATSRVSSTIHARYNIFIPIQYS